MTDPTTTPKLPAPPNILWGVAIYTILMFILWVTGLIAVSFLWVIGPAAYFGHMSFQAGLIKFIVQKELATLMESLDDLLPEDMVAQTFHDATPYEGSLN